MSKQHQLTLEQIENIKTVKGWVDTDRALQTIKQLIASFTSLEELETAIDLVLEGF
jgi:hypothetical protein